MNRSPLLLGLFLAAVLVLIPARSPAQAPALDLGEGAEALRIESPAGTVQYDEERNLMYGSERVVITFRERKLEADSIVFDPMTREAQAFGNVIMEGPDQHFEAEAAWYNFNTEEGMAYNVRGWDGDLYMSGPEFRQLSAEEILFRRAASNWDRLDVEEPEWVTPSYTTCDFPVPHIKLTAREFNLYNNDRIFARRVVLRVMNVPILYLPFFTRSLGAGQPWEVRFGYSSFLGMMVNVRYNYRHRLFEPDPVTGELRRKAAGHLRAGVDYFSHRGIGYAAEYGYHFDFDRQRGNWQTYFIEDEVREDQGRYLVNGAHRWEIDDHLVALIGADFVSDPEMYEDYFSDFELSRGRIAERRLYGALTFTEDDFVSRLSADWRQRLTRDRYTNMSEPSDNNDDYFHDPDFDGEEDLDDPFESDRYATVSERFEYRLATTTQQIVNLPLYYSVDLRAFGNLDNGLNRNRREDDARVYGVDFYQSLLWQIKLTDRLTLLVRGGVGLAVADRDNDSFEVGGPFPRRLDNTIFENDHAFYVGTDLTGVDNFNDFVLDGTEGAFDTELMDMEEVDSAWAYGDAAARLQARLSDALVAYAEWRIRESTGQNLGEFWAEAGNPSFLQDLYAFRLEEHWLELGVRHSLWRPSITSGIRYEHNLQSDNEIFNNERRQRISAYTGWENAARTVALSLNGGVEETQLRHPSDPRNVQLTSAFGGFGANLTPRHQIWSDSFNIGAFFPLEDDPFNTFDDQERDNALNENDYSLTATNLLNVKISPLWNLQWFLRITAEEDEEDDDETFGDSDNDDSGGSTDFLGNNGATAVRLQRDLHDAILELGVSTQNDSFRNGSDDSSDNRVEGTVSIRFRSSAEEPIGVARPQLIVPPPRTSEIDEGTTVDAALDETPAAL